MDIKVAGVSHSILEEALEKARVGRLKILEIMNETINSARQDVSAYAPKVTSITIPEDKIGALIGTGGSNIRAITEQSGADVNINDDGTVVIYAKRKENAEKAIELVRSSVEEPEIGKEYDGIVKKIMDFGAFVEFLPGKDGLLHISKISAQRIESVSDVLSVGEKVRVKISEIDRLGRVNLANPELSFSSDRSNMNISDQNSSDGKVGERASQKLHDRGRFDRKSRSSRNFNERKK